MHHEDFNKKALHQLIYYFYGMKEKGNKYINSLVAANGLQWYLFFSSDFKSVFIDNCDLYKQYKKDVNHAKYDNDAPDFYDAAKDYINNNDITLKCIYLDLSKVNDSTTDDEINKIYNLLSPQFLLGESNGIQDHSAINKKFYEELLHIIGLEEVKESKTSSNLVIKRKGREEGRGSLMELIIPELKDRGNTEDESEKIAFELCITWINRLLFIKLLEEQIRKYKEENKKFLNSLYIKNFSDLQALFFRVLGTPIEERDDDIKQKYPQVPYLNSSLFEMSDLENNKKSISISNLNSDCDLPYYDKKCKKEELKTLEYLLNFLDSYDFGSEKDNIASDKIINASILGRIFEKLNGYEDGAFFTPSNITTYMSRDALEKVVVNKFNSTYKLECNNLRELKNELMTSNTEKLKDYNNTFNSIRICDPAVGSGHFLVSVLNELIRIKADLQILCDDEGIKFTNYDFNIEDDELVIREGADRFHYNYKDKESQRLQETLFNEKRTLIENCLFGVDINPNSVNICRLRLWIELLKNAYYKPDTNYTELETLPNIDINIKQGDSLFSKLDLNAEPKNNNIKQQFSLYREQVKEYKNTKNKSEKNKILDIIRDIKQDIHKEIDINTDAYLKYKDAKNKLENQTTIFGLTKKEIKEQQKIIGKYEEQQKYPHIFEWRIEFPEVLDSDGNYEGFDLIIGNPPYIQIQKIEERKKELYKCKNYEAFNGTGDLYCLFYERGIQLLKENGFLAYITSNSWMKATYGKELRKNLSQYNVVELIDLGSGIFDTASVSTNILLIQKNNIKSTFTFCYDFKQDEHNEKELNNINYEHINFPNDGYMWLIESVEKRNIKNKIFAQSKLIKDIADIVIRRGVTTGYNEAFIIDKTKRDEILKNCRTEDERKRTEEVLRPVLRPKSLEKEDRENCIKRYSIKYHDTYLINTHNGVKKSNIERIKIEDYPAVKKHLDNYYDRLVKRYDQGDTPYNLRNCAYLQEFDKEKIIYGRISSSPNFYLDKDKFLCLDSIFIITYDKLGYLIAFFNSKLFNYCFKNHFADLGGNSVDKREDILSELPVKDVSDQEDERFKKLVYEIQDKKKNNEDTSELEANIDKMIYELYGLTEDEIKEVENN